MHISTNISDGPVSFFLTFGALKPLKVKKTEGKSLSMKNQLFFEGGKFISAGTVFPGPNPNVQP